MNRLLKVPSAEEQQASCTALAEGLNLLGVVSKWVLQGAIGTDGAKKDQATGGYILPFDGNEHYGQRGGLWLPRRYHMNTGEDPEAVINEVPTFSYNAVRRCVIDWGALSVLSCRPDVVVAAVPPRPLPAHKFSDRRSWIAQSAAKGQVAVIKDGEIMGDDGAAAEFTSGMLTLFLRSARAAHLTANQNRIAKRESPR